MRSLAGIALRDGLVFVAKRKAGGALGGKWEFPGGKLEPGESDAETLVREYDEEFALPIEVVRFIGESEFFYNDRRYELAAWTIALPRDPTELREHDAICWVDREGLSTLDLADSDRTLLPYVLPLVR